MIPTVKDRYPRRVVSPLQRNSGTTWRRRERIRLPKTFMKEEEEASRGIKWLNESNAELKIVEDETKELDEEIRLLEAEVTAMEDEDEEEEDNI